MNAFLPKIELQGEISLKPYDLSSECMRMLPYMYIFHSIKLFSDSYSFAWRALHILIKSQLAMKSSNHIYSVTDNIFVRAVNKVDFMVFQVYWCIQLPSRFGLGFLPLLVDPSVVAVLKILGGSSYLDFFFLIAFFSQYCPLLTQRIL